MSRSPNFSRRALLLGSLVAALPLTSFAVTGQDGVAPAPCFTDAEREAIRVYWNAEGRYTILPSPDAPERVNVTVEGSAWFHAFNKVIVACRKTDPVTAGIWQGWWDQNLAKQRAEATGAVDLPMDPGATPESLVAAMGSLCPPLFEKVSPTRYTVTFAPEDAPAPFVYEDGIDFGKRAGYYAYYRQRNGVIRPGRRVKDAAGEEKKRLETIFARAGRTDFERRVLQAVSQYEGGFEAINTYDTGFVSIGFIQFITAIDGTGSLSEVLLRYKTDDPNGFQKDFRRFGVDVSADRVLVCVNTTTGAETRGADAVRQVIDDKRLTAVFERAAAFDGFRLAQVAVARSHYWPGEDTFPLAAGTIRVSDVVRSEAGMATLMDKKVNRGNIRDFADVAAKVMTERGLKDVSELAKYERSLIAAMKYRGDFLADNTLTQPPTEPSEEPPIAAPAPSPVPSPSPIVPAASPSPLPPR